MHVLLELMRSPSTGRSVEYMDNRISLYAAQYGCCAITGKPLATSEIHCHHKQPVSMGGSDRYENLVIVHWKIHLLIHATQESTIQQLLLEFKLCYGLQSGIFPQFIQLSKLLGRQFEF